jgi:signal transduction histidine kinase
MSRPDPGKAGGPVNFKHALATHEENLGAAVDLNATISELEKVVRSVFGERFQLRTKLDPLLGRIEADPKAIDRLLVSLVINAQEPTVPRTELTVSTSNVDSDSPVAREMHLPEGEYVQLEVMIGHSRVGELHTVRDIVRQTHGAVFLRTCPQQGSIVTILLPRAGGR